MPLRTAALALLLAGCTGGLVQMDTASVDRRCGNGLWGESFASVDELECGLGPDGPVMCHWTLAFGVGTYEWSYSDVGDHGTVTCDGTTLVGTSSGGAVRHGTFQRSTGRVVWEGVPYVGAD